MIPRSGKERSKWPAVGAMLLAGVLALGRPAVGAIESDPGVLYQTMRTAYDRGTAKGWPFGSELYYQTTVFDAGRSYSLFRPDDPNYAQVAQLAVDVATQLHYDPLVNNDAALWYVLEAASYVAKNGDPAHQAAANALLQRLNAAAEDPKILAEQAEADAQANAQTFLHDGDAAVLAIVADVRAYNLTRDESYRSALLQHAADPATPLESVPDPEFGEMFALAASALEDAGFSDADRAAARAIKFRRDHSPELKTIARVSAIPHELRLTRTAPADEYFGNLHMSPLGFHNEIVRINKYLDVGWGYRMESAALQVDSSVEDWQKQYPHDTTLPAALLETYRLLQRIDTDTAQEVRARVKSILLVQYAGSPQAQQLAAS